MSYTSVVVNQGETEAFAAQACDLDATRRFLTLRMGETSIIFHGYNEEAVESARKACVTLQIAAMELERRCRVEKEAHVEAGVDAR